MDMPSHKAFARPDHPMVRSVPDDFDESWRMEFFTDGYIDRKKIGLALSELMTRLYLYQYRYDSVPHEKYFDKVENDNWFEGIPAFARHIGLKLASGIGSDLKAGERLSYNDFEKSLAVNYRKVFGDKDCPFDVGWAQDREFILKWADALTSETIDLHDQRLFLFARLWDNFPFSLRIFSDPAACEFLRIGYLANGESTFNLDTYRKDIRGTRRGLGLTPVLRSQQVFTWDHQNPYTFFVNVSAAKSWGIAIEDLDPKPIISSRKYTLEYIE